jgi:hypothetical protein
VHAVTNASARAAKKTGVRNLLIVRDPK